MFLLGGFAQPAWSNDPSGGLLEAQFPPAAKRIVLRSASVAQPSGTETSGAWISPEFSVRSALWTRVWLDVDEATYARIASIAVVARDEDGEKTETVWRNPGDEPEEEDLRIALPPISRVTFRLVASAAGPASGAEPEFVLARVLMQPEAGAEETPTLLLDGVEAALAKVTDQRLVRRYSRSTHLFESTVRGATWERLNSATGEPVADFLKSYALSVPRISRKAPACDWEQYTDAESKREADRSTLGCTAFRVGEDLFATAWHCVPDNGNGGCANLKLHFGFESAGEGEGRRVVAKERCEQVVFRSSRLDVAIMRVERKNFDKWSAAPVLKFVTGSGNLPFQDEPLAILHYPAPDEHCNPRAREADVPGQLGLRLSRWSKSIGGGRCKVLGKGVGGAGKRYHLNPPRDPKSVCDFANVAKRINRDLALGHHCATCEGSSGAPVVSLSDDPARQGLVLGVHVNGADSNAPEAVPNRAVRAHAIADCLDIPVLNAQGIVRAAPGANSRDVCACTFDDVCPTPHPDDSRQATAVEDKPAP